jgi:hypothetical protein
MNKTYLSFVMGALVAISGPACGRVTTVNGKSGAAPSISFTPSGPVANDGPNSPNNVAAPAGTIDGNWYVNKASSRCNNGSPIWNSAKYSFAGTTGYFTAYTITASGAAPARTDYTSVPFTFTYSADKTSITLSQFGKVLCSVGGAAPVTCSSQNLMPTQPITFGFQPNGGSPILTSSGATDSLSCNVTTQQQNSLPPTASAAASIIYLTAISQP